MIQSLEADMSQNSEKIQMGMVEKLTDNMVKKDIEIKRLENENAALAEQMKRAKK